MATDKRANNGEGEDNGDARFGARRWKGTTAVCPLDDKVLAVPIMERGSGSSSVAERQLPKLNVAGSIPVSRSKIFSRDDAETALKLLA
jgi:hypothetical protein